MKVIQTVAGVVEAIQREIHIEDLLHEAKEQVRQTHVLYQQDFFRQLLHSRRAVTRELFEELGVPLRADVPLLLTLCRAEELPEDYMEAMRRMQSIRQLLARYIAPSLSFFILFSGGDQIALFAQPSPIQTGADGATMSEKVLRKAIAFLAGTLEAVQEACRDTLGMPVSFVIASDACSWDDIPNEYAQLYQLLSYRIGVGVETFITMMFSGGLIPWYMVIRQLGMIDTIWALVLPGAVPVFNIILLLNFFREVPKELSEAAFIDGASHLATLVRIYIPVSLPALATILLKAYCSALGQLPRVIRERLDLQRRRPHGPHPLWPWLTTKSQSVREYTHVE
jgi:ABC-type proline/glycine betaine transport system permease subunit